MKKEQEQRLQEKAEIQKKKEEEYMKQQFKSSRYNYIYNHEYYIRAGVGRYLNYINDLHVSQGKSDIIMDGYTPQYNNNRGIENIPHRGNHIIKGKIKLMSLVTFENEMRNHSNYNLKRILKIEKDIFLKYCEDKYYKHNLHILSKYETKTYELREQYRCLYKAGPASFEAKIIATFITKYYSPEEVYSCFLKAYNYLKNFTVLQ